MALSSFFLTRLAHGFYGHHSSWTSDIAHPPILSAQPVSFRKQIGPRFFVVWVLLNHPSVVTIR